MLLTRIIAIARKLPFLTVAKHIFNYVFQQELKDIRDQPLLSKGHVSSKQKVIASVYSTLPSDVAAQGLAFTLLHLVESDEKIMLIELFRSIVKCIGKSYDAVQFVRCLIKVSRKQNRSFDEKYLENVSRLILESTFLMFSLKEEEGSCIVRGDLTSSLQIIREANLDWCITTYANAFNEQIEREQSLQVLEAINSKGIKGRKRRLPENNYSTGAGPRDFTSVFDNENTQRGALNILYPITQHFINSVERILLLPNGKKSIESFLNGGNLVMNSIDHSLIKECISCETVFDDHMLQIILESTFSTVSGMTSITALLLLESLFLNYSRFDVNNIENIWSLYKLAKYIPREEIPSELAYPGRWWRITSLVLVSFYC